MRQFVDVGRAEQLVSGRRRLPRLPPRTSSSSATTRERTRPCPAQRSDTRRLTASMQKQTKRNGALDWRTILAQRSTERSHRAAEHRFSRLLINNAALLMATTSPLRRAQTGNGRPHKCFSFADRFFANGISRVHRADARCRCRKAKRRHLTLLSSVFFRPHYIIVSIKR